jgi:polyhydroxybutyrate depolymerase
MRTWNAGGGRDGWQCTSGRACASGVDDIAYLDAVRAVVQARVPAESWFATGLSNGGAMSYRLACERAGVFRAIAPIGAGNQAAAFPGCAPEAPVALLHVHGTADPCWGYEGGSTACAQRDGLRKVGVRESIVGDAGIAGWATHLGCSGPVRETALPDTADDGMRSVERRHEGCAAPLVELVVEGGGHTVPDGFRYLRRAGPVTRDLSGSRRIVAFFDEVRGR